MRRATAKAKALALATAAAAAGLVAPGEARAELPGQGLAVPVDSAAGATFDVKPRVRDGFTVGVVTAVSVGQASGYPNEASKIDDRNFYSSSGVMAGPSLTILAMGALADYVNFGAWYGTSNWLSRNWHATGWGIGFRVEVFPLYPFVPRLKDLGLAGQFGFGSARLETRLAGNYPSADGSQSFLGVGVFHEWSLGKSFGGHFAAAPTLEYQVITSRSIDHHGLFGGARIVFYAGK